MVYTRYYESPPVNRNEIFRYAGAIHPTTETEALLNTCIKEADCFVYKVCYFEADTKIFENVGSKTLSLALEGCDTAIVFAASVGLGIDRLIAKYSSLSPAKALMLQAIGTERVESLCDLFCNDISQGRKIKPRVSAGYGDIPLELQKDIFNLLNCQKNIGLTLNESLIMSPTKSVTAIFGVKNERT